MDIPGNTMAPERIIQHLYWGEELSQELVAERLGCSPSLIYKQMKTLNIPTRTRAQAKRVAMKYNRINIRENYKKGLKP